MDQASLRSPVTKHFPEQCRLRAWACDIRGAQLRGRLCMFVVQHRRARAHVVVIPSSCHRAMEKLCRVPVCIGKFCLVMQWCSDRLPCAGFYYCVAWNVMLSGASREVARLPLCRCGYKICTLIRRVLVCGVDFDTCWFCWRPAQQCFSCMR